MAAADDVPLPGLNLEDLELRRIEPGDDFLLRTATWLNANWVGERLSFRDVQDEPRLRHYAEFRPRRGDFGWVAHSGDAPVGVAWCLFLPGSDPGYGFVADGVPELSICVLPGYRGLGVGAHLLEATLEEAERLCVTRVSLSVEHGNPAIALYRRTGFTPVPGAAEGTMVVTLPRADGLADVGGPAPR